MNMRLVSTLVLGLTLVSAYSFSQAIYITDTSMVSFFSATPVENIEAFNTTSTSMLNVSKKEIVFRVPISGFKFQQALMEEHFNENYMESEKYPYATFKGKLSDSLDLSKDTIYSVTATGMMNVHGQDRAEAFSGFIVCKNGRAALTCDFAIALRNYNIKVPKVVFANIAEVIEVKTYFEFKAYEEK
jgi:hypothetical protein